MGANGTLEDQQAPKPAEELNDEEQNMFHEDQEAQPLNYNTRSSST